MAVTFTTPSECVFPTSDNVDGNLVVSKGDYIIKSDQVKFMAIELLGCGTFGQVFRCVSNNGDEVAIKVVKSINKYFQYEMNEVRILKRIKELGMTEYFVELHDAFIYKQHLCIVIELLGRNLYDLSKILGFNGFAFNFLKLILKQLLEGLTLLHNNGIIHSDLKPENILLEDYFKCKIKIIDFGSSSTKGLSSIFYIQSRFYRAPEVILGIPYSNSIDMWSLGCIAYELMVGEPLFPGSNNADQIARIHNFLPNGLPLFMLEHGKNTHMYFEKENNYKPIENSVKFTFNDMKQKIYSKPGSIEEHNLFIDFLLRAITPSYLERDQAHTLLEHPYLTYEMDRNKIEEPPRYNSHVIDSTLRERKMSMYDLREFKGDSSFSKRKGSFFDPEQENRYN